MMLQSPKILSARVNLVNSVAKLTVSLIDGTVKSLTYREGM